MNKKEAPFLAMKTPRAYLSLVGHLEEGYKLHRNISEEYNKLDLEETGAMSKFIDYSNFSINKWVSDTHTGLVEIYSSRIFAEKFATSRGTLYSVGNMNLDVSGIIVRLENKLKVLHEYLDMLLHLSSPLISIQGNFIFQNGNFNIATLKKNEK